MLAVVLSLISSAYPAVAQTTSGLAAAWSFNEGSGTSTADASGGGHTGTLVNGPAWVTGQFGTGLSFDGVNDAVSVANPSTLNFGSTDFTIMAWVKRSALGGSAQRHIFAKCSSTSWGTGCKEFYFAGDTLRFGSFATGDVNSISIADTSWHHVAVTFTRSTNTLRIYVDGTLRTTATRNLEADGTGHVVTIGNMRGNNPFSGVIDEVRVYSQARSAAQIETDRNQAAPPVGDVTAPVLSNGQPTGTLAAGTTQATLGLTTNEPATCRHSATPGVAYAAMSATFSTTGGTTHATVVSGLVNGQTYRYYVRCQDTAGNANTTDYSISFAFVLAAPTVSLTAMPATIFPGQSSTLAWTSTNATSCTATGAWTGSQPLSGEVTVLTASTATYTLTCTGAGGSATRTTTITVTGGAGQLTLAWTDNAAGTAVFKIQRKTGVSGTYAQIGTTGLGATGYVDATVVTGTTYCYRVCASNANGDSAYSNEACGAP